MGVPEEWLNNEVGINADRQRSVKTDSFPEEVRAHELPEDLIAYIKSNSASIGKPMVVKHNVHIEVCINSQIEIDPDEPLGLKGLTVEMKEFLENEGI